MAEEGTARCIDILLAIILPPLGVFLKFGCKVTSDPANSLAFMNKIDNCGVLDLSCSDVFWLSPWNHLRREDDVFFLLITVAAIGFRVNVLIDNCGWVGVLEDFWPSILPLLSVLVTRTVAVPVQEEQQGATIAADIVAPTQTVVAPTVAAPVSLRRSSRDRRSAMSSDYEVYLNEVPCGENFSHKFLRAHPNSSQPEFKLQVLSQLPSLKEIKNVLKALECDNSDIVKMIS
ncbi:hypothetical protein HHK36_010813 [Tetracentron sinense]|uniref:Uncharacterized protein n=1 Tax=Tetracentron sinense TaxID=13715 RepID=A0A835DJW7_TETSI|nr:hypothetical protein HHK36_010813 [Tetracentron sinense]